MLEGVSYKVWKVPRSQYNLVTWCHFGHVAGVIRAIIEKVIEPQLSKDIKYQLFSSSLSYLNFLAHKNHLYEFIFYIPPRVVGNKYHLKWREVNLLYTVLTRALELYLSINNCWGKDICSIRRCSIYVFMEESWKTMAVLSNICHLWLNLYTIEHVQIWFSCLDSNWSLIWAESPPLWKL